MGHRLVTTTAKQPGDCSPAELDAFKGLVLAGNQLAREGLDTRIKAAVCLVFQHDGDELMGVCALKEPLPSYKQRVFEQAESPDHPGEFPLELGWMFIAEKHRGKGFSR